MPISKIGTNGLDQTDLDLGLTGNVGIGTSTPAAKLHVSGISLGNSNIRLTNTFTNGRSWELNPYASGVSDVPFTIRDVTAGADRITIDSSGNVGINNNSPVQKLDVGVNYVANPTTPTGIRVSMQPSGLNPDQYGLRMYVGVTSTGSPYNQIMAAKDVNGYLAFTTGASDTERMRIDGSGNVLVGTTTAISTTNTTFGLTAYGQGTIAQYTSADTNSWGRSNNGNVHVFRQGTTIVGNINITASATAYVTSSDYRLKDNVTPMTGALEKVAQLNPVNWTWKSDGSDGQGFIAHELQAVVPDCVTGEKDAVDEDGNPKYQGVDTSFLVATLTKAIQEQQEIIESLKARVEALENK